MSSISPIKTKKTFKNARNLFECASYYSLSTIIKKIKDTKIKYSISYYKSTRLCYPVDIAIYCTKAQFAKYEESLQLYKKSTN